MPGAWCGEKARGDSETVQRFPERGRVRSVLKIGEVPESPHAVEFRDPAVLGKGVYAKLKMSV